MRAALEPLVPQRRQRIAVVIPTLNEEAAIAGVLGAIPAALADLVIVADGGSTDRTVERARAAHALTIAAGRGYGRACRAGAQAAADCDVVVFVDGDGSDCPEMMPLLLRPILDGEADFVLGSRTRGRREPGSMNLHQILAGRVIGAALRLLYGVAYGDMGPMRAIRRDALAGLGMREERYGWNLEMQMRAARAGLRIVEVPVDHRRRNGGESKVSGNVIGSLKAGAQIVLTFIRLALDVRRPQTDTADLRKDW